MNIPLLIFTKHKNSFSVHVDNLEQLDVTKIQKLQEFVSKRNGIFDFESYTFSIQKKLEFDDFVLLLKHSNIDATCKENRVKSAQNIEVEFGKYKGMLYSEIPDNYLLWLKANYRGSQRAIIDAEIKSRSL